MPETADAPVLDEDTGPVAAQGGDVATDEPTPPQVSPEAIVTPSGPEHVPGTPLYSLPLPPAPAPWSDVKALPQFQKLTPTQQGEAFTNWVQAASTYGQQAQVPRQNVNALNNYVQTEGKNYGLGFMFNPDGTPMTVGQEAATRGIQQPDDLANRPFTVPIESRPSGVLDEFQRNTNALTRGIMDLAEKVVPDAVSNVAHFAVNVLPGDGQTPAMLDSLDKGLALVDLNEKERETEEGGLTIGEKIAGTIGNVVSSFGTGASLPTMAAIASSQAADQTYDNAIDAGATPLQATASAGVAATVSGATFAVLGPLNRAAISTVLGNKAPLFLAGGYRPTVAEAAKLMGLDASGLAATGYVGQLAQNQADERLYDPTRPWDAGALEAAGTSALFALMHAPTMVKAFYDNRTPILAAKTAVDNAQNQLTLATTSGKEDAITSAQRGYVDAKNKLDDLVSQTATDAPPATPDEAEQAKAILQPQLTPEAATDAPTAGVDALIDQTDKEASSPTELPVVGEAVADDAEITKQPEGEPADVETAPEAVPATEPSEKVVEPQPAPEQGTVQQGEKTPENAGEPATQELTGLDRPALEQVAASEGHTPEDIAFAKTDDDLRGLIETHRAGQDVSAPESLVPSEGALVDPKIASLPEPFRAATESFIKQAQKWGLRGVKKFVIDSRSGSGEFSAPVFARPRDGHFDTVYLNPVALARDTAALKEKGFSKKDINHLHALRFSEEFEHNIGGRVIHSEWQKLGVKGDFGDYYAKKLGSVYDQMNLKQRKALQTRYGNDLSGVDIRKNSDEVGNAAASRFGEEHLREVLQRREGKGITEDAIQAVRNNKPMRSIIKGIVNRLKGVVDKLRASGKSDSVIEQLIRDRQNLLGEQESESKPIRHDQVYVAFDPEQIKSATGNSGKFDPKNPKISASSPLKESSDADYLAHEEAAPSKESQVSEDKSNFEKSQEKWQQRLEDVKDVPLPNEVQQKLYETTQKMARFQFGSDNTSRDVAEANTFTKAMVQAREWVKENGSLDAPNAKGQKFAATTIIRNSLLDEGRRASRIKGETLSGEPEAPETQGKDAEGQPEGAPATKGVDLSETDNEANQQAFEGTGQPGRDIPVESTPRSEANNARVNENIQKVFSKLSPYERRLLELANDDPKNWMKDAVNEFGLSEPVIRKDMKQLRSTVEKAISQASLGAHDFQRMSGTTPLTDKDKPVILSNAAALKWQQTKTVLEKIRSLAHDFTSVSKFNDWVKYASHYGTLIAKGIQNSNAILREFTKLLPDSTRSGGVIRYIEAGGDKAILEQQLKDTLKNPDTKHLAPYYEAALNLTPKEIVAAKKVQDMLESTRKMAATWGINIPKRENYFPHNVEMDADDKRLAGTGDNLNVGFKYGKQRTHATMFDGEQAGIKYKTNDAAEGIAAYYLDLNRAVNARKFVASLSDGKEDDGRPMVAPSKSSWDEVGHPPDGQVHLVMDAGRSDNIEGYRHVDIPALKNWAYAGKINDHIVLHQTDLWVNPRTAKKIENVFGSNRYGWFDWNSPSFTGLEAIGKRTTKFFFNDINAFAKSNLFALSPVFHPVQIGMESLGHKNNPMAVRALTDAAKFIPNDAIRSMEGIKPPDFNDPETADAVDHSLNLHPEESELEAEGGSNINLTFLRGLEILGQKLGKKTGEVATYFKQANQDAQNWIFQKYIPAIKLQSYKSALDANMKRFSKGLADGSVTPDDVKFQTAKSINYAFGHLNYRVMARNPNLQVAMRTLLLAPDFFEARAMHLGQSIQGLAGSRSGRENFAAMARITLGLAVSAQVANVLLNGETDLSHPFEARINNRYYGLRSSPGDAFNLFKDSWAFLDQKGRGGLPYLANRASPFARFIGEIASGRNWRGEKIGSLGAITDLIAGATPMALQGALGKIPGADKVFVSSRNNTVSPFETALSALGVKVSRYSPIMAMKGQAHDFINSPAGAKAGLHADKTTYPVSQYRPLEFALEDANNAEAMSEYQKLVAGNNPEKVSFGLLRSINHPFTGTPKGDAAFYSSLDAHDKQLFQAAKQRQQLLMVRYREMLQQAPK